MIDLRPDFLDTLKRLLAEIVPDCEVRIFGSRYNWTATDASDLDLALVGPGKLHWKTLARLKSALEESSLPYRVDVLDWRAISPEFQQVIKQGYEVIQKPELAMSSKGWNTWKIGDIGRIVTGKTPPTQNPNNFGDKHPFITPRDMLGQKCIHQTERYLSEEGKNTVKNCLLPAKSVCVSCIGSDMGKVVMTTADSVTNQQLNSVICKASFDPDFVYYALVNISDELRNVGHHSTAVPILNKTDFSNFEITAPDIVTQRRIADVLSALDERIELNRQTIATLEAIAQAIFKEWFVDFNFPGATGEMQDRELGPIPKGWRVGTLAEFGEIVCGKTPPKAIPEFFGGHIPFVKIPDLHDSVFITQTVDTLTDEGALSQRKKFIPPYSVVVSCIATVGLVALTSKQCQTNQQINAIVPSDKNASLYLYFVMKSLRNTLKDLGSGGSATLNVNTKSFADIECRVPIGKLIKNFSELVKPLFNRILETEHESSALVDIRDNLLPKLMSGEIAV